MGLDKKIQRSVNIAFPLKKGTDGIFKTNTETIDAVADDLKILILTNHGERPGNYGFGANLRPLLFENTGEQFKQKVADSITAAVEKYMNYVKILSIEVLTSNDSSDIGDNGCTIRCQFSLGSTDLKNDVTVSIK